MFKAIQKYVQDTWFEAGACCHFDSMAMPKAIHPWNILEIIRRCGRADPMLCIAWPRWFYALVFLPSWDVYHCAMALVCRFRDHDWEDESWGGPEGGGMAANCRRCGESFRHILY